LKGVKDPKTSDFEETLMDYITAVGLDARELKLYDFSTSKAVLVTSIPGTCILLFSI
jgi:hypothetical protein